MKKSSLFLALLFLGVTAHAEYYPRTDEWPLPREIRTQGDLEKYQNARKNLLWGGVALLTGAVVSGVRSSAYGRKAGRFPVNGPVIGVPVSGGGTLGVQTFIPGALDRQSRYRSKQAAFRQGAIAGALFGAVLLGVSLSLRF